MAYDPNEQFVENAGLGSQLRVEPRTIQPKTLAGGTGTLEKLTAMAVNSATGFWVPWTNGGANETGIIRGFLWPDEHTLVSGSETIANILLEGKIHRDDVPLNGETQGNLDTALVAADASGITLRDRGIIVQGISGVK